MLSFAGFLSRSGNVAPHAHQFLSAHADERLVHVAYVRTDGRVGSFCVPPARMGDLLPDTQCVLIAHAPMTEGVWEAPAVFAALEMSPQQNERAHYALEPPLLSRIAGVFLQRGLETEAALSRTLDKFPAAMSTIFLLKQNDAPTLVATRRGPPIWLRQRETHFAVFAGLDAPAPCSDVQRVEIGDTIILGRGRLSIVDIDGMRMEKVAMPAADQELSILATAPA